MGSTFELCSLEYPYFMGTLWNKTAAFRENTSHSVIQTSNNRVEIFTDALTFSTTEGFCCNI